MIFSLLVKVLFLLSFVPISSSSTGKSSTSCTALKSFFKDQGLQKSVILSGQVHVLGNGLKVCPITNQTCCTLLVEEHFKRLGKKDFDNALSIKLDANKQFFDSKGKTFGDTFKYVIRKSKTDLNDMFVRTYGHLYQQNVQIFMDLFAEFEKYFSGQNLDLTKVLGNFFNTLMRKIFQLINPELTLTSKFLDCVTGHIDSLKPFGNVPTELTNHIRKSFVAARALVGGLDVGQKVLSEMRRVSSSESCQVSIAKIKYCSLCSEDKLLKPCPFVCRHVFNGCFLGWETLSSTWVAYIVALEELTDKLIGPFSFEAVLDPIDVKISDAIMNMQEGSVDIKKQVFSGCGKPGSKTKRSVSSSGDFFIEAPKRRRKRTPEQSSHTTPAAVSLHTLIKDFKTEVKRTKEIWRSMAGSVCSRFAASSEEKCWNGTAGTMSPTVAVPTKTVLSDDLGDKIPALVNRQIDRLKLVIQQLKAAKDGEDVFIGGDGEEDGSGVSGSGSGSGDNEIPTDNSRTLSATENNSVEGNVFGGGLSKDTSNSKSLGTQLKPTFGLVIWCLCVLFKLAAL